MPKSNDINYSTALKEYCAKPNIDCQLEEGFILDTSPPEPFEIAVLIFIVFFLLIGGYLFFKKGIYIKLLPPYKNEIKAIISGWVIWCLCVFAYSTLFEESVEYLVWLTLPVVCAVAIYYWLKKFVIKKL